MSENPSSPEPTETAPTTGAPPVVPTSEEEPHATPGATALSPAVAAVGFVILTLLGVVIFQNVLPGNDRGSKAHESPRLASLKADLETRRAELNRTRVSLGLEPIATSGSVESASEVASRLKQDADTLSALAASFESLIREKEAEIDGLRAESVTALQAQKRLQELLDTTRRDLDRALLDASLATTLRSDLEATQARIASLEKELAESRTAPASLRQQLSAAEAENARLHDRIGQLEQQIDSAPLFASSDEQIRPEALALYEALHDLEGKTDSEISNAYSRFGAKLGANVLHTCTFDADSAEITAVFQQELPAIAREAPEGATLFVVGYASETGDAEANRTLSSDRATHVAGALAQVLHPSQKVQAAYLGQTDRFSSRTPERNQIVEIWAISPEAP